MAKRLNLPRAGASQPVAPAAAAPGGGHSRLSGAVSRMALDSPAPPPPFASSQGSEDPAAGPGRSRPGSQTAEEPAAAPLPPPAGMELGPPAAPAAPSSQPFDAMQCTPGFDCTPADLVATGLGKAATGSLGKDRKFASPWAPGFSPLKKPKRPRHQLLESVAGAFAFTESQPLGSQDFLRSGLQHFNPSQGDGRALPPSGKSTPFSTSALKRKLRSPPCHRNVFLREGDAADPPGFSLSQQQCSSSVYRTLFREMETIGCGSFSRVYRCQHRLDGTAYAVKKSLRRLTGRAEFLEALQEVQAYRAVGHHPHIVNYHTSWVENDQMHIQLELCCEGSVAGQFLGGDGKVFGEADLLTILKHVASALAHMHGKGICHLDVKPDNIYVHKGVCKLGDLGVATSCDGEGLASSLSGDSRYMAPEQLNPGDFPGKPDRRKADVFALGATLFELASGRPLPASGSPALRQGKMPLLPACTARFQEILQSMLAPDPARRPAAAELLRTKVLAGADAPEPSAQMSQAVLA